MYICAFPGYDKLLLTQCTKGLKPLDKQTDKGHQTSSGGAIEDSRQYGPVQSEPSTEASETRVKNTALPPSQTQGSQEPSGVGEGSAVLSPVEPHAPSLANGHPISRWPTLTLGQRGVATGVAGVALLLASFAWGLAVVDGDQPAVEFSTEASLVAGAVVLVLVGAVAAAKSTSGMKQSGLLAAGWGVAALLIAGASVLTTSDEIYTQRKPALRQSQAVPTSSSVPISEPVAVQVWFLGAIPSDAHPGGCSMKQVDVAYAVGGVWSAPWLRFFEDGTPGAKDFKRSNCNLGNQASWLWRAPEGTVFIAPLP